jgi:hypothetical protein
LVHFGLLRLVQRVEVPNVATVRFRDVLVRTEVFDRAAGVLGRPFVIVLGETLVIGLTLPLGIVLVRLTETVFVVFT